MKQPLEDEKQLRKYLLGLLNEDEQINTEERLMVEDDLYDLSLVVEDELIDDYVMDALSVAEREQFEKYFLSTPERRRKLSVAMDLRRHAIEQAAGDEPVKARASSRIVKVSWWERLFSPAYIRVAAAMMVLIVAGVVVYLLVINRQTEIDKGLAALNRAYSRERPLESRITGLDYAPFSVTRGSEQKNVDSVARDLAASKLLEAVNNNPSAAAHHALGRFYVADGQFDKAIEQFEKALSGAPDDAQIHNDYGVALLEKGKAFKRDGEHGKAFEEFGKALEHLNRALAIDGSLFAALFNRALCHQYMDLSSEAEQDWNRYIKQAPASKWTDEAGEKLKSLKETSPQSLRNADISIEEFLTAYRARDDNKAWELLGFNRDYGGNSIRSKLIDEYLSHATVGRADEARQYLNALTYASDIESQTGRDFFLRDVARIYKSATRPQLNNFLEARSLMKSGHDSFSRHQYLEAFEDFRRAKAIFERAGNSCEASYAAYYAGNCYLQQSKAASGLAIFQPLAKACESAEYRWLLARALSSISNANQHLRDFSTAIINASLSLKAAEETGDVKGALDTRSQLADIYRFVNNGRKTLDLYARDLPLYRAYLPQPAQQWALCFSISRAFDQIGLRDASMGFQKEALRFAIEAQSSRRICRSYNYIGMLLARAGNYPEAVASIERAIEAGNSLPEGSVRAEAVAYSFLQLGYIYRKIGDYARAVENYDEAIRSYDELGSKFFAFTARKDKLLCCLEQSSCPSVEPEMQTLLALFEEQRSKILEESNRNTFFDAEQTIYDVAIEYENYQKGDSAKAFEYSEISRGRSLGDLASTKVRIIDNPDNPDVEFSEVSRPLSLSDIQARMPEQSQIVQYAVLKNSILIWVVSKEGIFTKPQSIAIEDLNKRVGSFLQLVSSVSESDREAMLSEAAGLYDLLISPVAEKLDSGKLICIVPDKILCHIPFGALRSQASQKYFIQEYNFTLSASSNMFVFCSEAASKKGGAENEKLLVVGNPLLEGKESDGLADLPSAAKESKIIAGYYKPHCLLIGPSAIKSRVMSEMERADVIHIATHAVANVWSPLRSKLLLAKDAAGAGTSGSLQAFEIYKLNLSRVKLVVLSACQTGVEKYYGGEGMIGLSRPFIARRTPLVVASLWRVDSDSTSELMADFHRYRKRGGLPTADALRRAQLDMIESGGGHSWPYHWAAFVTIGGQVSF